MTQGCTQQATSTGSMEAWTHERGKFGQGGISALTQPYRADAIQLPGQSTAKQCRFRQPHGVAEVLRCLQVRLLQCTYHHRLGCHTSGTRVKRLTRLQRAKSCILAQDCKRILRPHAGLSETAGAKPGLRRLGGFWEPHRRENRSPTNGHNFARAKVEERTEGCVL